MSDYLLIIKLVKCCLLIDLLEYKSKQRASCRKKQDNSIIYLLLLKNKILGRLVLSWIRLDYACERVKFT